MKVKHGITLYKKDLDDDILEEIRHDLVVPNPKYLTAIEHGRRPVAKIRGTYVKIPKHIHFMREYQNRIEVPLAYIETLKNYIDIPDGFLIKPEIKCDTNVELRGYQEEAALELMKHNCGIICSPAASGKTVMAIAIINMLDLKTLWIAHRGGLVKQAIATFEKYTDSKAGFIGEQKYSIGEKFTGAIVNSVELNIKQVEKENFELIFIDEVHRAPTSRMFNALIGLSPCITYGLSATPFREDGLSDILYRMLGPIRSDIERTRLENEGFIVTPHVDVIQTNIKNLLSATMEYHEYIEALIEDFDRNFIVLQNIAKHSLLGKKCLVLCDRTSHCDYLYGIINSLGIRTVVVHGKNKKAEKTIQQDVASGKYPTVITTYQYFSDGFDIPELQVLFFVAPFSSIIRCEQTVGRVQRICQDKPDAKVIDFVDENPISRKQLKSRLKVYEKLGCKWRFINGSNKTF